MSGQKTRRRFWPRICAKEVEAAAPAVGLQIQVINANTNGELDTAFASLECEQQQDALFADGNSVFKFYKGFGLFSL
jgi:hypothetical protein